MIVYKRIIFGLVKIFISIYLKLFCKFQVWGKENIASGPKIFCSNHFSSTDPFFVITLMSEPVHMIIGPGFNIPIFKNFLNAGEQISAKNHYRGEVIESAIKYLLKGESIYIFPEGNLNDQSRLLDFYNGIARLQLQTKVPIIPIGIVSPKRNVKNRKIDVKIGKIVYKTLTVLSGEYCVNIGKPLLFDDKRYNTNEIIAIIRNEIIDLINDIKVNKFWN